MPCCMGFVGDGFMKYKKINVGLFALCCFTIAHAQTIILNASGSRYLEKN